MKVIQTVILEDKERKILSDAVNWISNLSEEDFEALGNAIGNLQSLYNLTETLENILSL